MSKSAYIQWLKNAEVAQKVPIFLQPYWLDVVADHWDVVEYLESGKRIAVMPYCWKGNRLTKRIYLPFLQFYQTFIVLEETISKEKQDEILGCLFRQLPLTLKQYFKLLPEYAAIDLNSFGYKKQAYTTYLIAQEFQLSAHHNRQFRKAQKQHLYLEESLNVEESFAVLESTFLRRKIKTKITCQELKNIMSVCHTNNCGKMYHCLDENRNVLAAVFVVYDQHSYYYLMGGYNEAFKNSGAMVYLLTILIERALAQQKQFNFCGSTNPDIARFFAGFGAKELPMSVWQKNKFGL